MANIIVTKELLAAFDTCQETKDIIEANNLWGLPVSEVLRSLRDLGYAEPTAWWNGLPKNEFYVRATGSVITMNERWQIFNPFTGVHEPFDSAEAAENRLIELSTEVLKIHAPVVVVEIKNEHGDAAWSPTDIHTKLTANITK